ncbi:MULTISPECIES: 1-acyl-sn-glycerol-3-phosphate acyltransferase [unclassified Actinotalea]|uniref:lysophospholipid acyltransferase family protein n=1 Tax=unclassified Actinotalea TaxID=2638618 RepID=UPI0015F5FD66|nr:MULTISPECIES: lysophospholipid acyltransferase family protein [unclassified Actinotalea]
MSLKPAAGDPASSPPGGRPVPRWSRAVGRFLAHVVWRTRVVGAHHVPASGPVILAANHLGVADGPVLHGAAPRGTHILVKEEAFRGPVGSILRAAGQIPVDRSGGRAALVTALAVLRRGDVVGIFPEGNRGRGDGSTGRAGVAWLAVTSGAPVVPVAVLGTRRTGESTGRLPGPRRRLHVEFGPPLVLERAPGVSGRAAVEQANAALREALGAHVVAVVGRAGLPLPDDA